MKFFASLGNKKILAIIIVFTVVSIGMGIYLYLNNPKMKFMRAINNEYKGFMSLLDQISNSELAKLSEGSTVISKGDVSFDILLSDQLLEGFLDPIADVLNDFSINYEYASDSQNNNTYVKLDSAIDENDFIDFEMYQRDDKKYIYLNDIYDKYIESDSIEFINSDTNQIEDITYLFDKIKISLISALNTSDFSHSNKQIDINNVIVYADQLTLTMTDKRMKEIYRDVLLDLKVDEKSLNILNKLSNTEKYTKDNIDKVITSLDDKTIIPKDIKIDLYIQKNEIIKMEVLEGSIKTFEYLNYFTFYPVKKITFFNVEGIIYSVILEQKEKNHLSYEVSFGEQQTTVKGTLTKTTKDDGEDKTWGMDISFVIMLLDQSDLLGTIKVNAHTTTKIGEKVEMIDITNTINEKDITEEEQSTIMSKLIEKLFKALPITPIEEEVEVL